MKIVKKKFILLVFIITFNFLNTFKLKSQTKIKNTDKNKESQKEIFIENLLSKSISNSDIISEVNEALINKKESLNKKDEAVFSKMYFKSIEASNNNSITKEFKGEVSEEEIENIKEKLKNSLKFNEISINTASDMLKDVKDVLLKSIDKHLPNHLKYSDVNKYMSLILSFLKNGRFNEKKFLESFNSIKKPTSFIEFKLSFKNKVKNPDADKSPPEAYTDNTLPCKNSGECFLKKLLWMKFTLIRVGIRTVYELINMPMRIIGMVVFGLCACVSAPAGEEYQLQCNNRTAQPGLVCTIPNMVYKSVDKISFIIWTAYTMISGISRNPISPIEL